MTTNPILPGFNPDPSICRVGKDYYLATSSFEYFPGVPVYHSQDLVNWELIGHALTRPSQLNMRMVDPGAGIFAPTLRYWKGRWYMATCCLYGFRTRNHTNPRGFYVWTDNIRDEAKWSDPIYFDNLGIDQDLFFDDDDRVYYTCARVTRNPSPGISIALESYVSEIDLSTGRNITPPVLVRQSTPVDGAIVAEGPHLFKKDGWYYASIAEGGTTTDHQECIYRSKSPLGPYDSPPEGINPFLHNGKEHLEIIHTGHADMIEREDGKWSIVFLGIRPLVQRKGGLSQLGRETFIAPLEWIDGWPVVNGGKKVGLKVEGFATKSQVEPWVDQFDQDKLLPGWYHLRTPLSHDHSLSERPGSLALRGNAYKLVDVECPAVLLRKQTFLLGSWTTRLDYSPSTTNQEAGLTVFWSCYAFITLAIRKASTAGRQIILRWTNEESDDFKEVAVDLHTSDPISFRVDTTETEYRFSYRSTEEEGWASIGEPLSNEVLVRERSFDSPYTGTHIGLFAQGLEKSPARDIAHFEYVKVDPR